MNTHSLYYFGNYSAASYAYKHTPTAETRAELKQSLLTIIIESERREKRVPPGIYIELAIMEFEDDRPGRGNQYLASELALYPESATLVNRLSAQMAPKDGEE
ncbi:MAG: DUF4810 domain-containing protein [Pseudomonadota bacterium]|nr:DUF4810 domain-containing protein [Pseudomonadota bacterium]